MCSDLENEVPKTYEIYLHKAIRNVGGIFFSCWWLFLTYMMLISRKDGLASYIVAYGFFALASCFVVYTISELVHSKFVVTGRTITRYLPFFPPRIYRIDEITKVIVHSTRRGGTAYRVYIGKKKVFELHALMVNCDFLLKTLQKNGVPFQNSIF